MGQAIAKIPLLALGNNLWHPLVSLRQETQDLSHNFYWC